MTERCNWDVECVRVDPKCLTRASAIFNPCTCMPCHPCRPLRQPCFHMLPTPTSHARAPIRNSACPGPVRRRRVRSTHE
eukprot:6200076-Pleurochrysis_carterae.AAC.5